MPAGGQLFKVQFLLDCVQNGVMDFAGAVQAQQFCPAGGNRRQDDGEVRVLVDGVTGNIAAEIMGGAGPIAELLDQPGMACRRAAGIGAPPRAVARR